MAMPVDRKQPDFAAHIKALRERRDPLVRDREVKVQINWDTCSVAPGKECCIGIMGADATVVVRIDMRGYGSAEIDEQIAAAYEFAVMAVDAQHYYEQWKIAANDAERLRNELHSLKASLMAKVNLPERKVVDAEVCDTNALPYSPQVAATDGR